MAEDSNHEHDVVALLKEQHVMVKGLMERIAASPADERNETFEELVRLLDAHEAAEEKVVYPVVRQMGAGAEAIVERRLAEETEAKKVVAKLKSMDTASDDFEHAFMTFQGDVKNHAENEEHEVFPLLMDAKYSEQRQAMGADLLAVENVHDARK